MERLATVIGVHADLQQLRNQLVSELRESGHVSFAAYGITATPSAGEIDPNSRVRAAPRHARPSTPPIQGGKRI